MPHSDTTSKRGRPGVKKPGRNRPNSRKQEFFRRLKENLSADDSSQQHRLVDEFRALILGR
jgi:hypothetical protein